MRNCHWEKYSIGLWFFFSLYCDTKKKRERSGQSRHSSRGRLSRTGRPGSVYRAISRWLAASRLRFRQHRRR